MWGHLAEMTFVEEGSRPSGFSRGHRLSCPTACGIVLHQGVSLRPLCGQVDAQALGQLGSPHSAFGGGPEKAVAPHSSTLAWKIPWMEELVGYSPWGHQELDTTSLSLSLFTFMHWRRQWQPTPSVLAWRIPGMRELGGLLSMGSHRAGHD